MTVKLPKSFGYFLLPLALWGCSQSSLSSSPVGGGGSLDAPQAAPGGPALVGSGPLDAARAAPQDAPAPVLSSTAGSIGCEHRIILTVVQTDEDLLMNSKNFCAGLRARDEQGNEVSLESLQLYYTLLIRAQAPAMTQVQFPQQPISVPRPQLRELSLNVAPPEENEASEAPAPDWVWGGIAKCGEAVPDKVFLGTRFEIQARISSGVLHEDGLCPVYPDTVYSLRAEYRQGEDLFQGQVSEIIPTQGYEDQWTLPLVLSLIP